MVKQLLEYVVKSIVNDTAAVAIDEARDGDIFTFKISVKPEDRGRLIGREGRTIRSLRVLAQTVLEPDGHQCTIEIAD